MMRRSLGLFGLSSGSVLCGSISFLCLIPSAHAADGDTAEAAPVEAATVEHIRAAIEAETDPELKAAMQEQLTLVETGELDLRASAEHNLSFGAPSGSSGELTRGGLAGGTPLPMPVVDAGGGTVGSSGGRQTGGEDLPPEARKELEELFKQGTGDPNSGKDQELREKAGEILEKYGIDPREMGAGSEGREGAKGEYGRESSHEFWSEGLERGGGFERALEQMAPEAREQMERHFGQERDTFERSFEATERGGRETSGREHEAVSREYEATSREYDAPTREFEAATREYEAPTHELEAPTREVETAVREYEAPQPSETPEHQYQEYPH